MAIYCLRVTPISRGAGRSSVGAAAYRSGEKIHNEYDDITHDYTRRKAAYRSGENDFFQRKDILHSEIILPVNAPQEYKNRSELWNAVENSERNSNARTAREVMVALPNELTAEQQIEITRDYIQRNFVDEGMCADFSIHSGHIHDRKNEKYPLDGLAVRKENPHAHIQLTVRPINKDGTWGAKSKKEYILDRNGKRIKLKSGEWKSRKVEATDWDKKETLQKWRENWAKTVNNKFEQLDIDERIDHRSLAEQGIDREPTKHIGVKAWNLEKKGIPTEQLKEHRAILSRNEARKPDDTARYMHELKRGYYSLDKEIGALNHVISETQRGIVSLEYTAEQINGRIKDINATNEKIGKLKSERRNIGFFKRKEKKAVDEQIKRLETSCKNAEDYFKQEFNITPEQAESKLKRLISEAQQKKNFSAEVMYKKYSLVEERKECMIDYQKLYSVLDGNPNKQKIQDDIYKLDKKFIEKLSPQDKISFAQQGRVFQEIFRKMQDIQEELFYERDYEYERERQHERGRVIERGR